MIFQVATVQKAIISGITNRCNKMYENSTINGIEEDKNFILATLLDPYFKNRIFDELQQKRNKDWLITEVEGTISKENLPDMASNDYFVEDDSCPFERLINPTEESEANQALSPPIIDERVRAISV
jgi:hypothetical protein